MSKESQLYWKMRTARRKIVNAVPALGRMREARNVFLAKKRNVAVREKGLETALLATRALQEAGIAVFLMYGTLLGAVRDHRLISHDADLDFGVVVEDGFSWDAVTEVMREAGFSIARSWSFDGKTTEQSYYADGFLFDVFGLFPSRDRSSFRTYVYMPPDDASEMGVWDNVVKFFDIPLCPEIAYTRVGDVELPVPENAEAIVERIYGPRWRVPDSDWVTGRDWEALEGVVGRYRGYPKSK